MLMTPPPGYTTTAQNQQNTQLLGKPGQPGVGSAMPASPALRPPSMPGMFPNQLADASAHQAQMRNVMKLLQGR